MHHGSSRGMTASNTWWSLKSFFFLLFLHQFQLHFVYEKCRELFPPLSLQHLSQSHRSHLFRCDGRGEDESNTTEGDFAFCLTQKNIHNSLKLFSGVEKSNGRQVKTVTHPHFVSFANTNDTRLTFFTAHLSQRFYFPSHFISALQNTGRRKQELIFRPHKLAGFSVLE